MSFNSFIPAETRLRVLWEVIGFTIKLSPTLSVFLLFFFFLFNWQQHSRVCVCVGGGSQRYSFILIV